jgi:hypothetical protein
MSEAAPSWRPLALLEFDMLMKVAQQLIEEEATLKGRQQFCLD